jgi:hypothetical protein
MYRFVPSEIDKLFLDKKDYHGLYYWYEDAKDYSKEINSST